LDRSAARDVLRRPEISDLIDDVPAAPWERPPARRLVGGVDPGQAGGISVVDALSERIVLSVPMPTFAKTINKKQRRRLDMTALDDLLQFLVDLGVLFLTVENVGVGFGTGGREVGEHVGILRALAYKAGMPIEYVAASKWKKVMLAPADKKESFYRAEALFIRDRAMIRGERGGIADGKAESAMIALYGCRHILTENRK
jgi:hypothetical protein